MKTVHKSLWMENDRAYLAPHGYPFDPGIDHTSADKLFGPDATLDEVWMFGCLGLVFSTKDIDWLVKVNGYEHSIVNDWVKAWLKNNVIYRIGSSGMYYKLYDLKYPWQI